MTYADLAKAEDVGATLGQAIRPDVALTPVREWKTLGQSAWRARTPATSSPAPTGSRPTSCVRGCCTAGSCGPRRTARPSNRSTSRRRRPWTTSSWSARGRSSASRRRPRTGRRRRSRRPPRDGVLEDVASSPSRTRTLFEHLRTHARRAEARTDEKGSAEKALREGRPGPLGVLPRRLHPARPDGAPRRGGRVERGTPDRLGRLRRPLPRAAGAGRGARHPAGAGPRDRARHGRRVRRQAHRRGRRRGGTPRPLRREARLGAVDARRGVHLGVLPAGGADRVPRRPDAARRARGLGVHEHQPRRARPSRPPTPSRTSGSLPWARTPPCPRGPIGAWGPPPTTSPASRSWTSWRRPPASIRSSSGWLTSRTRGSEPCSRRPRRSSAGPRGASRSTPERGVGLACGTEKDSVVAACVEVKLDRSKGRDRGHRDLRGLRVRPHPEPRQPPLAGAGVHRHGPRRGAHRGDRVPGREDPEPAFLPLPGARASGTSRESTSTWSRTGTSPPAGGGETPIIAVAPAIANAVFAATGVRLRSMPLRGDALRKPSGVRS